MLNYLYSMSSLLNITNPFCIRHANMYSQKTVHRYYYSIAWKRFFPLLNKSVTVDLKWYYDKGAKVQNPNKKNTNHVKLFKTNYKFCISKLAEGLQHHIKYLKKYLKNNEKISFVCIYIYKVMKSMLSSGLKGPEMPFLNPYSGKPIYFYISISEYKFKI